MKPQLHLLGLPHTQTTDEFSHCAFTGKVKKFSPMMRSVGYEVIHYGVEGADSGANTQIDVLSIDEWNEIRNKLLLELHPDKDIHDKSKYIGDLANVGNGLYTEFNDRLRYLLRKNVQRNDIICLPFGYAHQAAIEGLDYAIKVETGIGYPNSYEKYRIFETHAWYHAEAGRQGVSGNDYWWVVPNYFISEDWKLNTNPARYVAYFGRLEPIKGLDIVYEVAKHRPDLTFVLCGQGDPTPYLTLPNIVYQGPIHGTARSDFLGNALAVLMPTRYIEPFGGVTVEAQLCGTPVLGSTWGSFTETIQNGKTGYRCHTIGDYLAGLEAIENGKLDRTTIRKHAVATYDYRVIAHQYDAVFTQLADLTGNGWYTTQSPQKIHTVTSAVDYNLPDSPKTKWAVKHKQYWDDYKEGKVNWSVNNSLLLASKTGIFDYKFTDADTVIEIGGGPYSILPEVVGGAKLVVDPAFYGAEVDQYYESKGVQYVPQPYETIHIKSKVTIIVNTIESLENYAAVLEHAMLLSDEILIAELLPIELYYNLFECINALTRKHNKKLIIIDDILFSNTGLVVGKII
jgi:glycosyltransferase involved in cell wall biosynthesis